jgi:Cdc6-like AAA superfamily ATPase
MVANESFEHLLPEVRKVLELSLTERISFIRRDNWIGYPKATQAIKQLHDLYHHTKRHRMPNLLLIGPTNNGKTMIIENFYRKYAPKRGDDEVGNKDILLESSVISLQMPSNPDIKRFYLTLLSKIEVNYYHHYSLSTVESILYRELNRYKVKMIIIDEIHNVLAGSSRQQLEFLNLLRFIGNELRIPLVCVGTKDAYLAIRSDPQLGEFCTVPPKCLIIN